MGRATSTSKSHFRNGRVMFLRNDAARGSDHLFGNLPDSFAWAGRILIIGAAASPQHG
tara:strand:+ start:411 stop:584 length:174 start_codon:yes stop_codon:yes gene_type:complete